MATTRKRAKTPEPIAVTTVCSMCGLGWELHGEDPTTDDCIRLLKAELAKRPAWQPIGYPQPYPVPYPVRPWPQPYSPWVSKPWTITYGSGSSQQSLNVKTPRVLSANCSAVAA